MFEDHREQIDEYETDSDEVESDLKNIQSFSTERVLHDPAELFVRLFVSTCYGSK